MNCVVGNFPTMGTCHSKIHEDGTCDVAHDDWSGDVTNSSENASTHEANESSAIRAAHIEGTTGPKELTFGELEKLTESL